MIGQVLFNALVVGRMRSAPAQSLVVTVVLVLGVVAGITLGVVDAEVRASIERSITRLSADVDLQVTGPAAGFSERVLRRVRGVPGLASAQPVIDGPVRVDAAGRSRVLRIEGVDLFALAGDRRFRADLLPGLYADRGRLVDPATLVFRNDLVVSPSFLAAMRLQPGATFTARMGNRQLPFIVAGVFPEALRVADPNLAFIDIGNAQVLFGSPGRIDRIDASVPSDRLADASIALRRVLPAGLTVVQPQRRLAALIGTVASLRGALRVLGLVILLLAAAVVANTAGSAVVERSREIAILRSLGVRVRSLLLIFLIEGALYGTGASFLGMMIGGLAAPHLAQAFGAVPAGDGVALGDQVRVFLISTLLATVAAFVPAWQAVRSARPAFVDVRPLRSARALAMGVAVLCAALILRVAVPHSATDGAATAAALLVMLGCCLCIAPAMGSLAGALLAWRAPLRPPTWLAATFAREPRPASIVGTATLVVAVALLGGAAIVEHSERVSAEGLIRAAYPGDVLVRDPAGALRGARAPQRLARRLISSRLVRRAADGAQEVILIRRAGVSVDDLLTVLVPDGDVPHVTIETTDDLVRQTTAPLAAVFALLRVALGLAFAIAVIGLGSGAFAAVLDRREQIATLRVVGASRETIARMVLTESALRAIAGCGLGLLAALGIAAVALARVQPELPLRELFAVLAASAAAVILSAAPGAFVAGRIAADRRGRG
jgi:ABC-type lipoprotein release transport system permease subunit